MDITSELFKGKSFSDILKDIHDNSKKKDRHINVLIAELKPLIKNYLYILFLVFSRMMKQAQ